jgi:AraC-like DNA-binding protein
MKASFQKILPENGFSFISRRLEIFSSVYHFHPEYELKYVVSGRGKRFLGSSVENFMEGDLVLVGPNIPHYWKNDPVLDDSDIKSSAYLIMFPETCLGNGFFSLQEMHPVKELLLKARGGICFPGAKNGSIPDKINLLMSCEGPPRIILFLEILAGLAESVSKPLFTVESTTQPSFLNQSSISIARLKKVHEYVIENFRNPISIGDVAGVAGMTDHAFCKYFRKSTKKTFMTFLYELRVCHAKKLLMEGDFPVADICFASGFENLSCFNRRFKEITGKTPTQYRRDLA